MAMVDDNLIDDQFSIPPASRTTTEIKNINLTKIEINDNIRLIKKSKWVFIALMGFQILGGVFMVLEGDGSDRFGLWLEMLMFLIVYGFCAYQVERKPVLAFSVGLGIYLLIQVVGIVLMGMYALNGYLFKIVIIGYLVYGLQSSFKYKKNLAKLKQFRIPIDELDALSKLKPVRKTPYPKNDD